LKNNCRLEMEVELEQSWTLGLEPELVEVLVEVWWLVWYRWGRAGARARN
jgi:hypothetical protein